MVDVALKECQKVIALNVFDWLNKNQGLNLDIKKLTKQYINESNIVVKSVDSEETETKPTQMDLMRCRAITNSMKQCSRKRYLEGKDSDLCKLHNGKPPKNGKIIDKQEQEEEEEQEESEESELKEFEYEGNKYYKDIDDVVYKEIEDGYKKVGIMFNGELKTI